MKKLVARSVGFLAVLVLSSAALAQFANKNAAFSAPGPGDPNKEYGLIVPKHYTIQTPKGVFTAGQVIGVAGKNITLLNPAKAEEAVKSPGFAGKNDLPPPKEYPKHALVSINIPAGVTILYDGKPVQVEGNKLILAVDNASMKQAPLPDAHPGMMGWNH